jgi:NADP-dependent 3-hydroxy acid dehydrogenase YdfG
VQGSAPPSAYLTAVVTGASRGIGRAIAAAFVAAGAKTFLLARGEAALQRVADALGPLAVPVVCDVADAVEVGRAVDYIEDAIGGVPLVLVNNAGIFPLAMLHDMAAADFEHTLAVNLVAPFRLLRAFLPGMRVRGSGHIVTIGSIADRVVFPENGAYAASKHGQRAMHEVLRQEIQGSGVRATLVSPGPVDTSIWDAIDPDNRAGFTSRHNMLSADAVAQAVMWAVSCPPDMNVDELRLSRT